MRTTTFKVFLYVIVFGGIVLCMSAAKNANLFQCIVQSIFGGALISIALEFAFITEKDGKQQQ